MHLNLRAAAGGMEESNQIAWKQFQDRAKGAQILHSYTTPQYKVGEVIQAMVSEDRYEYVGTCDGRRPAIAAARIVAGLARAARFAPPPVRQNPDLFATAISGRGIGFCESQLMARVSWYANIANRNSVTSDNAGQMVLRRSAPRWTASPRLVSRRVRLR